MAKVKKGEAAYAALFLLYYFSCFSQNGFYRPGRQRSRDKGY